MHHHHHGHGHPHPEPFNMKHVHMLDAHARYHREMLCKAYETLNENLDKIDAETLTLIKEYVVQIAESENRVNAALQSMQEQIQAYAEIIAAQGVAYNLIPLYDAINKNLCVELEVDTDG